MPLLHLQAADVSHGLLHSVIWIGRPNVLPEDLLEQVLAGSAPTPSQPSDPGP